MEFEAVHVNSEAVIILNCVVPWVNKLWVKRAKWIRRYISPNFFTGTIRSTQRVEAVNSVVVRLFNKIEYILFRIIRIYRKSSHLLKPLYLKF